MFAYTALLDVVRELQWAKTIKKKPRK